MSQTLRISGQFSLFDTVRGTHEILAQRSLVELARTTTIKAAVSQLITTTAANINIGNLTSEGWAVLWNDETDQDSATYIMVGWDVGGTFTEAFRVSAGEFPQLVSLSPDRTWQAKTNASTATLNGYILQRNA